MLSDGHEDRLMISSSVDRRDLVETSRKTASDISSQDAIDGGSVQSLEEGELPWIRWSRLIKSGELLDNDV